MNIKAKKQGVSFLDYDGGKYRNIYNLLHEVEGQDVVFGQIVDTNKARLFYLDYAETAFSEYAAFETAYYVKFPERNPEVSK